MKLEHIIKTLGPPYFQTPNCAIYCGDSLSLLKRVPLDSIDLTVTSPPYNIGKAYEVPMQLEQYLDWLATWIEAVYQVTQPVGSLWLNLGYLAIPNRAKAIPIPYLIWERVPFYLIQEIVWHYGAGVAGRNFYSPRNEKFLWYVKDPQQYVFNLDAVRDPNVKYPNQKKNGKIKVNPLGKNPSDVWHFPKVTSGANRASKERTPHPAQFPMAVIERIIKASSHADDLVFDPFLGSGTTAVVALSQGRQVLGFELRPDYCALAAERVSAFLAAPTQPTLFEEWQA